MFLPITSYPNIFRFLSIFGFPERLIKYDFAICTMMSCLEIDPFNSMQGYNWFFQWEICIYDDSKSIELEIVCHLMLHRNCIKFDFSMYLELMLWRNDWCLRKIHHHKTTLVRSRIFQNVISSLSGVKLQWKDFLHTHAAARLYRLSQKVCW